MCSPAECSGGFCWCAALPIIFFQGTEYWLSIRLFPWRSAMRAYVCCRLPQDRKTNRIVYKRADRTAGDAGWYWLWLYWSILVYWWCSNMLISVFIRLTGLQDCSAVPTNWLRAWISLYRSACRSTPFHCSAMWLTCITGLPSHRRIISSWCCTVCIFRLLSQDRFSSTGSTASSSLYPINLITEEWQEDCSVCCGDFLRNSWLRRDWGC